MKIFYIFLAIAPLLALPKIAHAEWQVIFSSPDYFIEFDPATVRAHDGYRFGWTRTTYTLPHQADGVEHQSQNQLHAVDCAQHRSTVIGVVYYSGALGQGEALNRIARPRSEWQFKSPPADSLGALSNRLICAAVLNTPRD